MKFKHKKGFSLCTELLCLILVFLFHSLARLIPQIERLKNVIFTVSIIKLDFEFSWPFDKRKTRECEIYA